MTPTNLKAVLAGGETSTVEFKRDDLANHDLAKALVAFLNVEGGNLLLGVADNGAVTGATRHRLEDWVSDACRVKIDPPIIPLLAWARDATPGKDVLIVQVPQRYSEVIVNALVHRDYSIAGTDISLTLYADRLEVESPGRLPNTVTVEGMKSGQRYARNQTLVNIVRDYGYTDARGRGVRNKMIPGLLAHNGTVPEFVAREHSLLVQLWKTAEAASGPAKETGG